MLDHLEVVGDHDAGDTEFVAFVGEQPDDLMGAVAVEGGGRFVDKQQVRPAHQGAGDTDALTLTTGQGRRTVLRTVRHPDSLEQLIIAATPTTPQDPGRQLQLITRLERRRQVTGGLEDEPDVLTTHPCEFLLAKTVGLWVRGQQNARTGFAEQQFLPATHLHPTPPVNEIVGLHAPHPHIPRTGFAEQRFRSTTLPATKTVGLRAPHRHNPRTGFAEQQFLPAPHLHPTPP